MEYEDCVVYDSPEMTGQALPLVTNASSGKASEDLYSPIVWRGKENPWGNISSLICDVLFDMPGEKGIFHPYKLSDLKKFDGTLNEWYVRRTYQTKNLLTFMRSVIVSFTTAGEDCFLIPAEFRSQDSHYNFAAEAAVYPTNKQGVRFLRVGGDYTLMNGVNHATYEMFGEADIGGFSGRLILQEV